MATDSKTEGPTTYVINTKIYKEVDDQWRRLPLRHGDRRKHVEAALERIYKLEGEKEIDVFDQIVDNLSGPADKARFCLRADIHDEMRRQLVKRDLTIVDFINAALRFRFLELGIITPKEAGVGLYDDQQ